jgi:16S rRNA processing protein RimM
MIFENLELVEVAYVVRPHGLKGQLNIKVFENISLGIFKENIPVFLDVEGIPVPFFIEQAKSTGNNILLKLKYIDSEDIANRYKSCSLYLPSDKIKEEYISYDDEQCDFYGYEVFDRKHGYIGKIQDLNLIPGNPVLETEFNGKTIILPYREDFIISIDEDNKKLEIEAPDGLIDIYLSE